MLHYITLLHSSHIIKTAASVQAGLPLLLLLRRVPSRKLDVGSLRPAHKTGFSNFYLFLSEIFLAVQNSSIGDLVTNSLTH